MMLYTATIKSTITRHRVYDLTITVRKRASILRYPDGTLFGMVRGGDFDDPEVINNVIENTLGPVFELTMPVHPVPFKLYVWNGILCDYSCGIAFAMARTVTEARALLKLTMTYGYGEIEDNEPTVYTQPTADYVSGGG